MTFTSAKAKVFNDALPIRRRRLIILRAYLNGRRGENCVGGEGLSMFCWWCCCRRDCVGEEKAVGDAA
jgi:hypothetical protein